MPLLGLELLTLGLELPRLPLVFTVSDGRLVLQFGSGSQPTLPATPHPPGHLAIHNPGNPLDLLRAHVADDLSEVREVRLYDIQDLPVVLVLAHVVAHVVVDVFWENLKVISAGLILVKADQRIVKIKFDKMKEVASEKLHRGDD